MKKIISIDEISKAMLEDKENAVIIDICNFIDIESCFDLIFDPPESFLATCKKYWEDFYNEMMCAKPSVPTFYACDEDGTLYFYHGKSRIRVSEHFKSQGKTYSELAAELCGGGGKSSCHGKLKEIYKVIVELGPRLWYDLLSKSIVSVGCFEKRRLL